MIPGSATVLRPSPRWTWLALALVLLWAGAVRIWMASTGLESGHYWDERYSVRNLRAVLEAGSLEPVNYYYPSLSYLPQAAVLGLVEAASGVVGDAPFSFFAGGGLHPAGYLLARLIQVSFGLGTLVLTFLLGRRLISSTAGLVAAVLLAVTPQHVRLSTMWKPDVTLLFAVLLALWWTLDALERPTLRRYLLAGAGVGLALAAKLNGGPIAAPLAIAALAAGVRDRRHWWGSIAAAAASMAVFVALNPHVGRYLAALDRNRELYSGRTAGPDPSLPDRLLGVAREEIGFLLSPNFHGFWIGAVALGGVAALVVELARRRDAVAARRALGILVFPLAYTALYALTTPYAKENNFLQILPFSALAAAYLVTAVGWWLGSRAPRPLRRPASAAVATAALTVLVAAPTQAWVYRTQVPGTWELAIASVAHRLRPWDGRVVWIETPRRAWAGQPRHLKALLQPVDDLAAVAPELLDHADAEVFPEPRLDAAASAFHDARLTPQPGGSIERFAPRWFRARGPTVVAIVHPRQSAGTWTVTPVPLADGSYRIELPPGIEGELLSVELWNRRARGADAEPSVVADGRVLSVHPRPAGRLVGWLTERFRPAPDPLTVWLPPHGEGEPVLPVRIYGWH